MVFPPPFPGTTGAVITILQLLITATSFSTETNAETRAQYSKFSKVTSTNDSTPSKTNSATWSSRVAMMVIYTPALLACLVVLTMGGNSGSKLPTPTFANTLCTIHFTKRCLEVMFLHKYSGRTDRSTPTMIGTFYMFTSILIAYGSDYSINTLKIGPSEEMTTIGTYLFTIGILGNFYHHYLLAQLRKGDNAKKTMNKKYVAPHGGFFSYVAAPHYFFEVLGWLGIALVSNQLNVYLVVTGMTSYLAGRSVSQNEFNKGKFDAKDWPHDRKNFIPFIF